MFSAITSAFILFMQMCAYWFGKACKHACYRFAADCMAQDLLDLVHVCHGTDGLIIEV